MADFLNGMYSWVSFLPRISKTNLVEIIIIAVLLYELLTWIMNTRAWTLLKG
ncbi:MAG TPA: TIGR00159 family protein, partial [Lachnoclostridium sp.]|nr:TIGR00159 family protein [Lachnoclostridium sp.]